MWIHFDNLSAAIRHLQANGWKNFIQRKKDFWLSLDGTCKAEISTIPNSQSVRVLFREIAQ